jgi:hypothetical protein
MKKIKIKLVLHQLLLLPSPFPAEKPPTQKPFLEIF